MNKFNLALVAIASALLFVFFSYFNEKEPLVMRSSSGCCIISVNQSGDIWTINYTDTTTGTTHTEVETTQVDADYVVNLYQDHCYTNH